MAELRIGRPQIREVFLRNGARIEPDRDDLPDWLYESVFELLEMGVPAVQGEPVAEVSQETFSSDGTSDIITKNLPIGMKLYAAPQPAEQPEGATHYRPSTGVYYRVVGGKTYAWRDAKAGWMPSPRQGIPDNCVRLAAEQQPAPDVAGLVEALGRALDFIRGDGDFEHREALERCECYACVTGEIIDSLAAHRKQVSSHDNQ